MAHHSITGAKTTALGGLQRKAPAYPTQPMLTTAAVHYRERA